MVYKIKATIAGQKMFFREYLVPENTTLYSFHLYLQDDLGFAPDQIVTFKGLSKLDQIVSEYGLFDSGYGSMDKITLLDLTKKGETKFHYLYNIYTKMYLIMEILGSEEQTRGSYPRLISEKGKSPDQFADKYEDFDTISELTEPDELFEADNEFVQDNE